MAVGFGVVAGLNPSEFGTEWRGIPMMIIADARRRLGRIHCDHRRWWHRRFLSGRADPV